jgi:hypothetical protein
MNAKGSADSSGAGAREVRSSVADPYGIAVAALTEIARQALPDPEGRRQGPDTADVLAAVLAAVAANVGGVEVMLAGRPGSWEADPVRQLVHGTVGEDESGLWAYRTEPVQLALDTEDEFARLGLTGLYLDDCDAIEAVFTDDADEATERDAERLLDMIDRLFDDDQAGYRAGYADVARAELARLGRPDLIVEIVPAGETAGWSPLLEGLHLVAAERTPLPATGRPPDWTTGSPADAVRAAGRGYLDRAHELSQDVPASDGSTDAAGGAR